MSTTEPAEKPADTLHKTAKLMREQHGPEHQRHTFWHALADWIDNRARDAQDAIVVQDTLDLSYCDDPPGIEWALKVARAYLGEAAT